MPVGHIDRRTPLDGGFSMPAEWAAHTRTWMCWPCRLEPWSGPEGLLRAQAATAHVARAIAAYEPVVMAVRPQDAREARLACGPGIEQFAIAIDDSWARDSGPTFLLDDAGIAAGVQWRFNAWGNKYHPYANDAKLAGAILRQANAEAFEAPIVAEGGALHSDGSGTVLTTEQCLLNENRNPELSASDVEELLAFYIGARKVVWLGDGFSDTETDGHIDNIACFAGVGRVIVGVPSTRDHPDWQPVQEALRRLRAARDAQGTPFEIIELQQPRRQRRRADGSLLPASYVNFYVCNGGVVVPAFDDPHDAEAASLITAAFPGRDVVQVPAIHLVEGGGGIHCITQQQPKAFA